MSDSKKIPDFIFDELAGVDTPAISDNISDNIIYQLPEIKINSFNLTRFKNACKDFVPNGYYEKLGDVVNFIKKIHGDGIDANLNKDKPDEKEEVEEIFDVEKEAEKQKKKQANKFVDMIKRYFKRLLKKILKPFRNLKAYFKKLKRRIRRAFNNFKRRFKRSIKNFIRRIKRAIKRGVRKIKRHLKKIFRRLKRCLKSFTRGIRRFIRKYKPIIRRMARRAFRYVKRLGLKTIRGLRRILQPAFQFLLRVFPPSETGSTKVGKLKSFASKLTTRAYNMISSGGRSIFKFAKKAVPFIIKMVKKLAIKLAPRLVKIFKVFVPFILKLLKKIVMIIAKAALSAAATAGTVATFGATAAGAILSYGLLIYEIIDTIILIGELAPELSKLAGELTAERDYMSNLEDDSEDDSGSGDITQARYTAEELADIREAGDDLEYQKASSIERLQAIKTNYTNRPEIVGLIDSEIRVLDQTADVGQIRYRVRHFEEVLAKEERRLAKIEDRMFFDDNGEQKFTIEGEKEMSALLICTKFIEYAKRKLTNFGTAEYFENLYNTTNFKNFRYEVNDLNLPEFAADGQMAVEEIRFIAENNKGIKGGALLAALNSNNFDTFEHIRPIRIQKDLTLEKQKEKYNFFVDVLVKLTGSANNHEKLTV